MFRHFAFGGFDRRFVRWLGARGSNIVNNNCIALGDIKLGGRIGTLDNLAKARFAEFVPMTDIHAKSFHLAIIPINSILMLFVAVPMTQTAAPAGAAKNVLKLITAGELAAIGALNRLLVPVDGNNAAVPVAQLVPVPV